MRIAVDARQVFRAHPRGIGKTTAALYAALAARKPDWHFDLVHQLSAAPPPGLVRPNVTAKCVDIVGDRFGLWESVRLPLAARGAAVLHCPANTGPRFPLRPMVVTVHDLIPVELNPDAADTKRWLAAVRTAVKAARHVTTVSEYSKSQIVRILGVKPETVTAIPHAADPGLVRVTDPAELDRVRGKYGLRAGEPYAFGFGAADPRKNTANLLRAFAGLPEHLRNTFRLLLVGVQGPALAGFEKLAGELEIADRVVLRGYADEADLPALLSGGSVLCFPSVSEGFGLPILDAFACGLPVLTSDRTSLPEVAGDAAVLVDPTGVEPIRDGLQRVLESEILRAELRAAGFERAKQFTWETAADLLAGVFERAAYD